LSKQARCNIFIAQLYLKTLANDAMRLQLLVRKLVPDMVVNLQAPRQPKADSVAQQQS
jgi:hypothetical protein